MNEQLLKLKIALDENNVRRNLSDQELSRSIYEYDQLKREVSGGADVLPQCGKKWSQQATAKDLGISQQMVSKAIQIVKAVDDAPELAKFEKGAQILRQVKIMRQRANLGDVKAPVGLYDVVVVDPPWAMDGIYDPSGRRGVPPYPTMNIEEIKGLNIPAHDDCILWLWTINRYMPYAGEIIESWGFEWKNVLTWCKDKMGLGNWLRNKTEHCIIATKGKPVFLGQSETTVLYGKRTTHSTKPEEFYQLVDRVCGGRKLEYFSRRQRDGWDVFGDEV